MTLQRRSASASSDQLVAAIDDYGSALSDLEVGDTSISLRDLFRRWRQSRGGRAGEREGLEARLMRALVARDRVRLALEGSFPAPPELLLALARHDRTLRASAPDIVARLGPDRFVVWREMLHPAARAWWWRLDLIAARGPSTNHPVWTLATRGLVFAISVALAFEVGRRFVDGGDVLGYFGLAATLSTVLLTALIASGRRVEHFLGRLEIDPRVRSRVTTLLAVALLLVLLGLRASLPWISDRVTERGIEASQKQQFMTAVDRYELAISLHPENAAAHYYLGLAHEDLLDYDAAMSSYQAALSVNKNANFAWDYAATNNLARLYMIHRDDFSTAFEIVNAVMERQDFVAFRACLFDASMLATQACPENSDELFDRYDDAYKLYKNRGWAAFGMGDYEQAEGDLLEAIQARTQRDALSPPPSGARLASLPGAALAASATCLLGQVYERQSEDERAARAYLDCIRWAPLVVGDRPEREWILTARAFVRDWEN